MSNRLYTETWRSPLPSDPEFGLTQRQMAERLGINPGTLRVWEAGEYQLARGRLEVIGKFLENR
jgi:putative aminopeptidase FrvX